MEQTSYWHQVTPNNFQITNTFKQHQIFQISIPWKEGRGTFIGYACLKEMGAYSTFEVYHGHLLNMAP